MELKGGKEKGMGINRAMMGAGLMVHQERGGFGGCVELLIRA